MDEFKSRMKINKFSGIWSSGIYFPVSCTKTHPDEYAEAIAKSEFVPLAEFHEQVSEHSMTTDIANDFTTVVGHIKKCIVDEVVDKLVVGFPVFDTDLYQYFYIVTGEDGITELNKVICKVRIIATPDGDIVLVSPGHFSVPDAARKKK